MFSRNFWSCYTRKAQFPWLRRSNVVDCAVRQCGRTDESHREQTPGRTRKKRRYARAFDKVLLPYVQPYCWRHWLSNFKVAIVTFTLLITVQELLYITAAFVGLHLHVGSGCKAVELQWDCQHVTFYIKLLQVRSLAAIPKQLDQETKFGMHDVRIQSNSSEIIRILMLPLECNWNVSSILGFLELL